MNELIIKLDKKEMRKRVVVGKGENKTIVLFANSSTDATIEVVLKGMGAKAVIVGIVQGKADDSIRITTYQYHQAPQTVSDLLIKTVLNDKAQFHYEGVIRVEKEAQQTNAYQKNNTLLLTPTSHAWTRPTLEILANDVRCTHGATLATIDKEQLFYLESRGIREQVSTQMIIDGFLESAIEKIEDGKIKKKLKAQILND